MLSTFSIHISIVTSLCWMNVWVSEWISQLPVVNVSRDAVSRHWGWVIFPMVVLQEGGPFSGPETGLLSNTQKWIVQGDTRADKARDFTGKGHLGREQEGKRTQEKSQILWWWLWVRMTDSWWRMHCSAKTDATEKDSGRWLDTWCLLLTFPELFGWWWLISSVFLTRTSCRKITHANGYYGAWPGWVASVSVCPLTVAATLGKDKKPKS